MLQKIWPQRPAISPDKFLTRYKSERRRNKMAPYYQSLIEEVDRVSAPAAIYHEYPLDVVPDLAAWSRADTCAITLSLCTLGPRLDSWARGLAQTDLLSAVIVEEITLAYIVAITREIHGIIRSKGQERGLIVGPAYRPGVGRWPLATQSLVFARLPAEQIGVSIDDYLVMTPKQSTSLIIPMRKQTHRQ